ncbi:MAG TPA: DUF456 domain-containing protein [Candidatus Paceibacterota bacterium]|nr:DUF456 domain-containing protein [Candidatus Paceibacterota bacterium]
MTTEQIIGLTLALLIMLIGFVGNILPGLPGTPLILVAALGHRLYFGQHSVSWWILVLLGVLTLISVVLDYLATYYGAKRFGATWRGGVGAAIGGIVGLFFGIPGILLGPFLGATVLELIGGHEFEKAAKAGAGATLGLFVSAVGKCALAVMMMGIFTVTVIWRS